MAEMENSRDLNSVLWSGADVLRSKMDANEYKDYLLGIVFYKYLSDSFLIKVYDMICDGKPESLKAGRAKRKARLGTGSGRRCGAQSRLPHRALPPGGGQRRKPDRLCGRGGKEDAPADAGNEPPQNS